ncbi:Gamma-butyrobetaine dioxygenase [Madurella fahalii]|uniref:Gamma-butyrobetaine dioxygenase n=1 Tax=Madurella fahalii TaxID=1157608 RepID=A0ABQ0GK86_9PEZI
MGRSLGAAVPAVLRTVRCAPAPVPAPLAVGLSRFSQRSTPIAARPCRRIHESRRSYSAAASRTWKGAAGSIIRGHETLTINLASSPHNIQLSKLWLRDACACPKCVDPDSGQKNFSTTDLPDKLHVKHAELGPDGSLTVVWSSDRPSGGAPHTSTFPAEEVRSWEVDKVPRGNVVSTDTLYRMPWNKSMYEDALSRGSCRVSYDAWVNDEEAFWKAFSNLQETGLIFIKGVPDGEHEVERIASRIGTLQETFYGRTWDVKSKPQAENVAYTSVFLGLHQDLMYYNPVPKLQLLHCLANSCEGGESLFSNGIRAAYELRSTRPADYTTLSNHGVYFCYQRGGHHYFQRRTTIAPADNGYPKETYWAPPFQTTFPRFGNRGGHGGLLAWKNAATAFQRILESPENMIEAKLEPGECVIFDNRRVLHGRRQFAAGQGNRWLKGCYISPQVYAAKVTEMLSRNGPIVPPTTPEMYREQMTFRESFEAADAKSRIDSGTPLGENSKQGLKIQKGQPGDSCWDC